jgi:flagellar motor switch protein FliN
MDDPNTPDAADAMASDALKAAQAAVAGLKAQTSPPAAPAVDPAASAALKAAQDAIAAAKALNEQVAQVAPQAQASAPQAFRPPPVQPQAAQPKPEGIDLLAGVNLQVKIELGRTRMYVEDVLRLGEGSVVELDKLAGDPVDVYVNDRHVAKGEVLVLNDNFCVRINEIIADIGEKK